MCNKEKLQQKKSEYLSEIKELSIERDVLNSKISYRRSKLKEIQKELDNINNLKLPI